MGVGSNKYAKSIVLQGFGGLRIAAGERQEAEAFFREALELGEAALCPGHTLLKPIPDAIEDIRMLADMEAKSDVMMRILRSFLYEW